MGSLQINVLGTSFAIKANEDDAYLERLLNYYNQITDQIIESGSLSSKLQISILAGIMLCDELYKEKSKSLKIGHELEKKDDSASFDAINEEKVSRLTLEMIRKLDKVLVDGI
ncbi:cell division protein ZapA [Treponema zioleckii]|uniref:cell division protein ZapA n=1 Tax=Treponema zioleckii TaxID=331680 RepID=UPI00168C09A7|nr:cell division protein ZapA [Treponema zioleckii]